MSLMRTVLILLLFIAVIGCGAPTLSLPNIDYGKENFDHFVANGIATGMLSAVEDRDGWYKYQIQLEDTSLSVYLEVNPDGYYWGNVRQIKLHLGGDTVIWSKQFHSSGGGYRKSHELQKMYLGLCDILGKPDNLSRPRTTLFTDDELEAAAQYGESFPSVKAPPKPPSYFAEWDFKKCKVTLDFNTPFSDITDQWGSNNFYSEDSNIIFSMPNYESRIQEIRDSIRATLGPNDLIGMYVAAPKWVDLNPSSPYEFDTRMMVEFSEKK
jgi:hypothetical protein